MGPEEQGKAFSWKARERAEDMVPETLLQVLKAGGHRDPANLSLFQRLSLPQGA